ncbi:MAG: Hsp20/alpha crystallin family protein [Ectothiorhodospiraceae bacterium]|jgi:HSP20 family protein
MSNFEELKNGLNRAWDHLAEGWRELRGRAGHALTRFHSPNGHEPDGTSRELARGASDWGLLPAEVREEDDVVEVRLEAPGMEPDQFDLQVLDGMLVVRGEKSVEREENRGRYYVMERAYGSFERAINLPAEVDDSAATARYRKGVLRVRLPKRESAGSQRITVQSV